MKSNTDYILLTIHDCVIAILLFVLIVSQKVRVDDLETKVARQQVQIEHQALDLMILKGK